MFGLGLGLEDGLGVELGSGLGVGVDVIVLAGVLVGVKVGVGLSLFGTAVAVGAGVVMTVFVENISRSATPFPSMSSANTGCPVEFVSKVACARVCVVNGTSRYKTVCVLTSSANFLILKSKFPSPVATNFTV